MIRYDLHVHTTASDGIFTPAQVVDKAFQSGLKGIAVTDHDAVSGVQEAVQYAQEHAPGFMIIPGVELNTNQDKESVHVLGYYMDYQSGLFLEKLEEMRGWREERAKKMVEKLKKIGYPIDYEEVRELAEGSVGRPHIARILVQKKRIPSVKWAFDHLLTRGKPGYVLRHPFTPIDAAELIHACHGIAVLAHPGLIKNQRLVAELLDNPQAAFDGIEVHYPAHKLYQVQKYAGMALERNLLMTGGSDFHGKATPEHASYIGFRGLDDEKFDAFNSGARRILNKLEF